MSSFPSVPRSASVGGLEKVPWSIRAARRSGWPGVAPEGLERLHEALPRHGGGADDAAQGCAESTRE